MSTDLFDRFKVIDVDTHLTEPPDVWTARMPTSLHDKVPHIERVDGRDTWMVNGESLGTPGYYSMAGFDGLMPLKIPETYDEIAPSMYDAGARLEFMDSQSIWAQILYPNVGGFGNGYFLRLGDREVVAQCVAAYNDFLSDWTAADPDRLIPITAVPFWDIDLSLAEIERCAGLGHRAVNFCNQPQDYGQPPLGHQHWDPIWALAQEAGLAVSFHVGGGNMGTLMADEAEMGWMTNFAKVSSLIFLDNMRCIADLIFGGVCHRFPDLQLVSVESGAGWIPLPSRRSTGSGATAASTWSIPNTTCCPASTSSARSTAASGSSRPERWAPSRSSEQHPLRDRLPPPHLPAPRSGHSRSIPPRLRPGRTRRPERRAFGQGAPRQRRPGLPAGLTQSTSAPVR